MKLNNTQRRIYTGLRGLEFSETEIEHYLSRAYSMGGLIYTTALKVDNLLGKEIIESEKAKKIRGLFRESELLIRMERIEIKKEEILNYLQECYEVSRIFGSLFPTNKTSFKGFLEAKIKILEDNISKKAGEAGVKIVDYVLTPEDKKETRRELELALWQYKEKTTGLPAKETIF